MARLSVKHANQQTVVLSDFTGGLNTTLAPEEIADNQLSECINLEPDPESGKLRTVAGTESVLTTDFELIGATYDRINGVYLLFSAETETDSTGAETTVHNVYTSDGQTTANVGRLTGDLVPVTALWEDGVLLASGGKLQYWNGKALVTLDNSPDGCSFVFIRTGRVLVACPAEDKLHYSSIGDEETWTEDADDASASVSLKVGYKDGGHYVAAVNLSDDVVIFKDNGYVYRLTGDYPDWSIKRISHEVDIDGRLAAVGLNDRVAVLGNGRVHEIVTTQDYGDMRATDVSADVHTELVDMGRAARLCYVPSLAQVWAIQPTNAGRVLFYDLRHGGYYVRKFHDAIVGVFSIEDETVVVFKDGLAKLKDKTFHDRGHIMRWRFRLKRKISYNEYLLKRVQVSVTPFFTEWPDAVLSFGNVHIGFPVPPMSRRIYGNTSRIFRNTMPIFDQGNYGEFHAYSDYIYNNDDLIYDNHTRIFPTSTSLRGTRCVYRNRILDVQGRGTTGAFVLNFLKYDIVEV